MPLVLSCMPIELLQGGRPWPSQNPPLLTNIWMEPDAGVEAGATSPHCIYLWFYECAMMVVFTPIFSYLKLEVRTFCFEKYSVWVGSCHVHESSVCGVWSVVAVSPVQVIISWCRHQTTHLYMRMHPYSRVAVIPLKVPSFVRLTLK